MLFYSWNVNGIRAIGEKGFLPWVQKASPDFLCLQEIKAHREKIPKELAAIDGYHSFFAPAKRPGYSGVAIYCKKAPLRVALFGDDRFDDEGRVIHASFEDFELINAYFPNSQEGGARLDYKLAFCEAMHQKCRDILRQGKEFIVCGDYNIAHTEIDLKNPEQNHESPGFLPQERAWMDAFLSDGAIDTFRHFCKESGHYTWWSYRTQARARNSGWRIDYHCISPNLLQRLQSASILCDVTGSDHCPTEIKLN